MNARRAILIMPGDSPRKIAKAATIEVDALMIDLEDAVAPAQKEGARRLTVEGLRTHDFGGRERLVRVNPVGGGLTTGDVLETIDARPDGYVLPKGESPGQIAFLDHLLGDLERERGWTVGGIGLHVLIESARAVERVHEIAAASPRIETLIFGSEDLAGDMGLIRSREGTEIAYARARVVLAAAAAGLQAIDGVYLDYRDPVGLEAEARSGAAMGYTGKLAIHPDQVAPIQHAHTPSDEAIRDARRLVEAAARHAAEGIGVFALDGRMIDPAIVRPAERLLERARAAGKLD